MHFQDPRPPIALPDPPPIPPDVLATAWIARRCRISPAIAALVRDLTGLGSLREGALR